MILYTIIRIYSKEIKSFQKITQTHLRMLFMLLFILMNYNFSPFSNHHFSDKVLNIACWVAERKAEFSFIGCCWSEDIKIIRYPQVDIKLTIAVTVRRCAIGPQ